MPKPDDSRAPTDPSDLNRFVEAQANVYPGVLMELHNGRKRSHWMWFIFPQIAGLGNSSRSKFYALRGREEARQYLDHPLLGKRLLECSETLLQIKGRSASEIFSPPDDMKLRSCMTLFKEVAGPGTVFADVLDRYFQGQADLKTLSLMDSPAF